MEFTKENNQWKITYNDSRTGITSFYHPTQVMSMHRKTMVDVSEETIKAIFNSDANTEIILTEMEEDGMNFDDDFSMQTLREN